MSTLDNIRGRRRRTAGAPAESRVKTCSAALAAGLVRDGTGFSRGDAEAILGAPVEVLFPAMRRDVVMLALGFRSSFDHGDNRAATALHKKGQVFGPVLVVPATAWRSQPGPLSKAA